MGNGGAGNIGIQNADSKAFRVQSRGQQGRHAALAYAALAGHHRNNALDLTVRLRGHAHLGKTIDFFLQHKSSSFLKLSGSDPSSG